MHQLLSSIAFLCLLALPLAAQEEALHGTWEGTTFADGAGGKITTRLTFEADGTFQSQSSESSLLLDFVEVDAEFSGVEAPIIDSFHQIGTYQVAGDSLWFDIDNAYYIVDGKETAIVDYMTQIYRVLARFAADLGGVSDEDYPAFEQTFIDRFLSIFDEEELFAELEKGGTYSIEGNALFLTTTTEGGAVETVEFHRIDVASAVAQTSWGALKAAWRP